MITLHKNKMREIIPISFSSSNLEEKTPSSSKDNFTDQTDLCYNMLDSLANINKAKVMSSGISTFSSQLKDWLKEHDIEKATLNSYNETLKEFKSSDDTNEKALYTKIESATPSLKTTSFVINELYRTKDNEPQEFIHQTLRLKNANKTIGTYTVVYNLDGEIEDEFLDLDSH